MNYDRDIIVDGTPVDHMQLELVLGPFFHGHVLQSRIERYLGDVDDYLQPLICHGGIPLPVESLYLNEIRSVPE